MSLYYFTMAKRKTTLNMDKFIADVEKRPAIWNRNYHCNKPFLEKMWEELSLIHKSPISALKAKWKGLRDIFRVEYKRIPKTIEGEFLIDPEEHGSKWIYYRALLFLTEHMRERPNCSKKMHERWIHMGGNSNSGNSYSEPTIVEPDLSNGLIHIPDSDEEFAEDEGHTYTTYTVNTNPQQPPTNNTLSTITDNLKGTSDGASGLRITSVCSNFDGGQTTVTNPNGSVFTITLKDPLPSEGDSNLSNASASTTMDSTSVPPDDDDYHYLLSLHPYMNKMSAAQKLRVRMKFQKVIFEEMYKEDLQEIK